MKYCLLFCVKAYWFFKSKKNPPKCIFKKSCSHHVYEVAKNDGFFKGIKALIFRMKNCSYGFELYRNPIDNKVQMILPNKMILEQKDIADRFLE